MKMKWILFFTALLPFSTALFGADAVFSKDNQHVYLVQWERRPPRPSGACSLIDVNLAQKTCAGIDLREKLGENILDIALSNDGWVLCATKSALWSYDPSSSTCAKVIDAPTNTALAEIAYDPSQSILLACCHGVHGQELFCLPKNGAKWIPVYNRRSVSAQVEFPFFNDQGALCFACRGDLWVGVLIAQTAPTVPALHAAGKEMPKPSEEWPTVSMAELAAYRYAPIASLETQNTTSDSTGLHEVTMGRRFVYGVYSRLYGGMSWGRLIRCDLPVLKDGKPTEIPAGSKADGKQAIQTLQSVGTIVDDDNCLYFCGSQDGSVMFYFSRREQKPFLITNDGKPEPLEIKGLDDLR